MGPLDLNRARKRSDAGRGSRRLLLISDKRLPVRVAHIGEQYTLRSELLQPDNLQIDAVKPDFPQDFSSISTTQDSKHIIARLFVVEFFKEHLFFLANLAPKQRVQQMLRPEIFDGLAAGAFQSDRPYEKFVFGRNRHAK